MSEASKEDSGADLLAVKAAIRTLLHSVAQHYEDEIGFRGEFVQKTINVLNVLEIEATPAKAEEIRARARMVLLNLFSSD